MEDRTVYLELWFDAEKEKGWKITAWYIKDKDFEPFETDYKTMPEIHVSVHAGARHQAKLRVVLERKGFKVYVNNYNPDSYFVVRPAWFERLLANIMEGDDKGGDAKVT